VTAATHLFHQKLTLDGTTVSLATAGADLLAGRPALLLLHGAGMDHSVWGTIQAALSAGGTPALAPDFPGHGQSPGQPLSTIPDLADWTVRVIGALALERPILAGHSLGALVALEAARRLGGRAGGLALIGAAAEMPVNPALLAAARQNPELAAEMIAGWGYGPAAQADGRAEAGRRVLAASPPGALAADLQACADYTGGLSAAARIGCRAVVIAGEKDRMTPASRGRALANAIAGARYHELPGIGHMLPEEAPERLTSLLIGLME
jgi:pimeloyl-ACP methyl ester carboxylesterase